MEDEKIRKVVREGYAKVATQESSCCGSMNSCCGSVDLAENIGKKIGYTEEELKAVPEGSNLGLGCGNPTAIASIKEGENVLDLGSGAGFDSFLATQKVGGKGKVIGIDMTPEMINKARKNARVGNYKNVEFRLGEIENLPVADNSVDVVISNCVINLSPDKAKVFREAFRVLKPGGRLMISDIVLLKKLPESIRNNIKAYVGCVSGAILKDEYLQLIEKAGFQNVNITNEKTFHIGDIVNDPTVNAIIKDLKIPEEEMKRAKISSISVHARAK